MSNGSIDLRKASVTPIEFAVGSPNGEADLASTVHRSASYEKLPEDTNPKVTPARRDSIRRSFSENVLAHTQGKAVRQNSTKEGSEGSVKQRRSLRRLGSLKRQKSTASENDPKITISKFVVGAGQSSEDLAYEPTTPRKNGHTPDRERKTRSVSGSLSNFARRRSWISSRSPSPSQNKGRLRRETETSTDSKHSSRPPSRSATDSKHPPNGTANGHVNSVPRTNSFIRRNSIRPLSSLLSKTPVPDAPSVPPIPKSFSTDKLPMLHHTSSTLSSPPAVPKSKSFERLQGMGTEIPRRRDELWTAFRGLDGEYQKFQSRPSTLKTALVRSALLPFLRTYADHPSITTLRPEDLDRRTVILNKWWTGLLEMLNGRNGESVSGNDRPAVLEAVTSLMVRPEWTLPPLPNSIRPGKTLRASLKSRSTTSLGSTMSDFLADSVYHNVRNTFTQNLLAQMAYVVDKMSTRNVPASVVTFCGKATAYAFFYCEGVAEILVRLWGTSPEVLRRILVESGIQKETKLDYVSERVCAAFPPCLHSLTFKTLWPMMRYLRSRPHVPIATAYIPWHGPWVSRWAGRDTDLFFVFTKFYMDLACRFLPDSPSQEERMTSPGWALVQAQILTILDTTMQRTNSQQSIDQNNGPSPVTFDDMLGEADVSATVLPLPTNGAVRSMAENRLIMLLRDCLSGSKVMGEKAQSVFAESFGALLRAAARHTSMYDHNACFTLCDFLEEAVVILTRYHQASVATMALLDWPFWLEVYKRMLTSHNSMTEVRLCSFIYSMWGTITSNEHRKKELCLDWLLTEDTFQTQFNHWCPMVRAFFMRLLIWRVGRLDGGGSDVDIAILEMLARRLHEVWCNYLHLQQRAESQGLAAPSTAPCSPAPGRCLLIMRNDVQPAPGGMFLTFDGILSSSTGTKANPYERHSSVDPFSQVNGSQARRGVNETDRSQDSGKKRWSVLKIFSTSPGDRPKTSANVAVRGSSPHRIIGTEVSRTNQAQVREGGSKTQTEKSTEATPAFRSLSFKFSLEWIDRDKNTAGRERKLQPPKLPLPAQISLQSRQFDFGDDSPLKPEGAAAGPSKYAGRALAEWALLIAECKNFFERRKVEGVPTYHVVETPTLGVEPFRKV